MVKKCGLQNNVRFKGSESVYEKESTNSLVLLKLDVPLLTSPIEAATANSVIIFFGFDLVSRWASLVTT